jgi:hypothetical protein
MVKVICLFPKEPFDWPNTNIFGTWSTPQHRSLNTFPSPKIEACFLIVLSAPLTPPSLQLIYIDKPPYSLSLFLSLSHIFKMKLKLKFKNLFNY